MSNDSLNDVPRVIEVPVIHNHQDKLSKDMSREPSLHTTSFETLEIVVDEFEEPPKLTTTAPTSPAVVKQHLIPKNHEPQVWQKRGRFIIWPAHHGDHVHLVPLVKEGM